MATGPLWLKVVCILIAVWIIVSTLPKFGVDTGIHFLEPENFEVYGGPSIRTVFAILDCIWAIVIIAAVLTDNSCCLRISTGYAICKIINVIINIIVLYCNKKDRKKESDADIRISLIWFGIYGFLAPVLVLIFVCMYEKKV